RELGSRVDRHQHIGEGEIGSRGFCLIMNERRLGGRPKILETPKGDDGEEDRRNLATLRGMVGRQRC
ncbi:MAG: deoxyribonuclease IV, partial [Acidobacteriota bacterium]